MATKKKAVKKAAKKAPAKKKAIKKAPAKKKAVKKVAKKAAAKKTATKKKAVKKTAKKGGMTALLGPSTKGVSNSLATGENRFAPGPKDPVYYPRRVGKK
jgi:streptogramin lyase